VAGRNPDTAMPSTSPDIGNAVRYVLTNVLVWVAFAVGTELLVLDGTAADGVALGAVGGLTYGVGNLLVRRFDGR
jgi:hypothetical protein